MPQHILKFSFTAKMIHPSMNYKPRWPTSCLTGPSTQSKKLSCLPVVSKAMLSLSPRWWCLFRVVSWPPGTWPNASSSKKKSIVCWPG